MGTIRVGCQTYTWEMLGEQWKGSVDDIVAAIADAGYDGVEITNSLLGSAADAFAKSLESRRMAFPSYGFVPERSFTDAACMKEEIRRAKEGIDFVSRLRLDLAGGSSPQLAGGARRTGKR